MYNHAKAMKKLRQKRRRNNLCTRCGQEAKNKEYALCRECRDYLSEYKKNYEPPNKKEIIIRELSSNKITNPKLYTELIKQKVKTKELAKVVNVTQRSVERWLFENGDPNKENQQRVNEFLQKEVY